MLESIIEKSKREYKMQVIKNAITFKILTENKDLALLVNLPLEEVIKIRKELKL